jgi:hypothetical protein
VVPTNIQHGPEVLHWFKAPHKPLVKALFNLENMKSHGESIKPVFHQLITWTPLKDGITLLELFGGIGIGFEALPMTTSVNVVIFFFLEQIKKKKMMMVSIAIIIFL